MPSAHYDELRLILTDRELYYFALIDGLSHHLHGFQYSFMDEAEYETLIRQDPLEAYRVYWMEILARAHLAAATGILRTSRWLRGISASYTQGNWPVFCSAYRGFVESSADIRFSLAVIPRSIVEIFEDIYGAVTKSVGEHPVLSAPLEDLLIHYTFGRRAKRSDEVPDSHHAKKTKEYLDYAADKESLERFGLSVTLIHDCYGELCEITHPAALSVHSFLLPTSQAVGREEVDESGLQQADLPAVGGALVLSNDLDRACIESFCQRYAGSMIYMLQAGVTPCLLTLGVLNLIGVESLRTAFMEEVKLDAVGDWKEWESKISRIKAASK